MKRNVLLVMAIAAMSTPSFAVTPSATASAAVERGRYLVTISGCNDCHTPKVKPGSMQPDFSRMLSGRPSTTPPPAKPAVMGEISASGDLTAWYGPWGITYASNLTPDATTGIGKRYDESKFIQAIRTGKKPDGTELRPPMPWPDFAHMSDDDLKAIWAFLQTLKPIHNNVNAAGAK